MKDRNKLWMVLNVADAIPFAIEAISFYFLDDITSALICGPAEFTFPVI